ncbi:MAG: hypothetical protein JRF37_10580, partial [Deltaproteobacteria bacterium]|nr:hypothetical protein [Deltaproteobacteria bacterium]
MIKGLRFFTSRVAKRIFGLFVLCAILPIGTLALVTFGHVAGQLRDQSHRRIQQECKSIGMAILERLLFLETEMETVAHHIGANPDSGFGNLRKTFKESLSIRFESLFILGGREQLLPIFGNPDEPPWPSKEELTGLRSEKIVLSSRNTQDGPSQVFMMHLIDVEHPDHGILVGRIRANYLWGIGDMNTLPAMSELSVFDESEKILLSS